MSQPQPDENGFVKRGLLLLAGMAILVAVVLSIILYKPEQAATTDIKTLPAAASAPGWMIRYNATIALLRRGSDRVPWTTVKEMLDEKQQLKNTMSEERKQPDEYQARSAVITTLQALAEWKRKFAEAGKNASDVAALAEIRGQVNELAASPINALKAQAEETKLVLAK